MGHFKKPYEGETGMVPPSGRRAEPESEQAFTRREKACVFFKITHPGPIIYLLPQNFRCFLIYKIYLSWGGNFIF